MRKLSSIPRLIPHLISSIVKCPIKIRERRARFKCKPLWITVFNELPGGEGGETKLEAKYWQKKKKKLFYSEIPDRRRRYFPLHVNITLTPRLWFLWMNELIVSLRVWILYCALGVRGGGKRGLFEVCFRYSRCVDFIEAREESRLFSPLSFASFEFTSLSLCIVFSSSLITQFQVKSTVSERRVKSW